MLDLVIPLGTGSVLKNFELRFCLRSIEKNLAGLRNVWIIGTLPEWVDNVNHIPAKDPFDVSDRNIMHKLTIACNEPGISEEWIMANDDHFLLAPFEASTFPYYYHQNLDVYLKQRGIDAYGKRALATMKHLQDQNLPIKHFDIHTPILYNKELFLKFVSSLNWEKQSYIIKSLYANSLKIEGTEEKDHKLTAPPNGNVKVFSTYPHMKAAVTRFLTEQFPKPSKYEKVP